MITSGQKTHTNGMCVTDQIKMEVVKFHSLFLFFMRYHYEEQDHGDMRCAVTYICNHPVYRRCTLYRVRNKGLAVIRQYYNAETKMTFWAELSQNLANDIFLNDNFEKYFQKRAGACTNGLYPTVAVRQIMWALRMKPLPKKRWETVFDRKEI